MPQLHPGRDFNDRSSNRREPNFEESLARNWKCTWHRLLPTINVLVIRKSFVTCRNVDHRRSISDDALRALESARLREESISDTLLLFHHRQPSCCVLETFAIVMTMTIHVGAFESENAASSFAIS